MNWRDRIADTLMRTFTPDSYGANFGSPQEDPDLWAQKVNYLGRLRDATQEGLDMPPDPRMRGWRQRQ